MNKGVIIQLEPTTAHILKNDGAFVCCPRDPRWQIGDVVTISSRRLRTSMKAVIISCAALLIVLFTAGAVYYNIPATYMEISVNPSVQITLNGFNRVLSVSGLNADGNALIEGVSYNNLPLSEAFSRLLNRMENNGYLKDAAVQLVVANNSQKKLDNIEQTMRSVCEKYTQANNLRFSIKRYANDEYLLLTHPLPVVEIPETQNPSGQQPEPPSNDTQSDIPAASSSSTQHKWHGGDWQDGWWDWDCSH